MRRITAPWPSLHTQKNTNNKTYERKETMG
jgi:hypothetical protein